MTRLPASIHLCLILILAAGTTSPAHAEFRGDPSPQLRIGLSAPATLDSHKLGANGDGQMRFRIELLNGVTATAPITVSTVLPDGMTFVSHANSGWTCSADGQQLTCNFLNNLTGSSWNTNVRIRTNVAGDIPVPGSSTLQLTVHNAQVPLPDPLECDNVPVTGYYTSETGCVEHEIPHRESKVYFAEESWTHAPAIFVAGSEENVIETAFYNQGFTSAHGMVTARFLLPPGFLFNRGGPQSNWGCSAAAPGAQGQVVTCNRASFSSDQGPSTTGLWLRVDMAHDVAVPGPHMIIATVENAYQPAPEDFSDCLVADPPIGCSVYDLIQTAAPPQARLEIVAMAQNPDPFRPGMEGRINLEYTNVGEGPAGPLSLTLAVPPGLGFDRAQSAMPALSCSTSSEPGGGQSIHCTGGSGFPTGGHGQVTLVFDISWAGWLETPGTASIGDTTRSPPEMSSCQADSELSGCGEHLIRMTDALFCDRFENPSAGCRPL